jgi:hypothetical protein
MGDCKALTNLLKKKQFSWSDEAQVAFDRLKAAMLSTPILALPNFDKPFVVETDASNLGFRVVLMQGDRPITFINKPLSSTHKYLSIYEEFMALIMALCDKTTQKMRGSSFRIQIR